MKRPYGAELIGKTVSTVEVRDAEVLLTFADGSEIAVTLGETGGDYGQPYLETTITPQQARKGD